MQEETLPPHAEERPATLPSARPCVHSKISPAPPSSRVLRRNPGLRALGSACALAMLAACTPETAVESSRVLGRAIGDPVVTRIEAPRPVSVTLDRSVRESLRLLPGNTIELSVPRGTRELLWSTGLPKGHPLAPTRIRAEARAFGKWRPFDETEVGGAMSWEDRVTELPRNAEAVRFRLLPNRSGSKPHPAGIWIGGIVFTGVPPGADTQAPPNIVLVSLDTLAASAIAALGGPDGLTPRLDEILADSLSFERAFAQAGRTLPSHAALFSGLYPHRSGITSMRSGRNLRSRTADFARAGYLALAATENGYVGSRFGFSAGFDQFDDGFAGLEAGDARTTFESALRLFETYSPTAPLFLFVHTYEVHSPYALRDGAAAAWLSAHSPRDSRLFEEISPGFFALDRESIDLAPEDVARLEALYRHGVRHLDDLVADFLARLQRLDPSGNTLVVLTADHGEEFEAHNAGHGSVDNDVVRVPLAFWWPGKIDPERRTEVVELIDVMPTILDTLAIPHARSFDGRNLSPLLQGEELPEDPSPFALSFNDWKVTDCGRDDCPNGVEYSAQSKSFKLVRSARTGISFRHLDADGREGGDASASHPEELQRHLDWLDATLGEEADAPRAEKNDVDPATAERLRALGYID